MQITLRDLLTVLHGMGFGALFMLAFTGAIAELYWMSVPGVQSRPGSREHLMLRLYLAGMVILAWAAVLTGAYLVYSWYRAIPRLGRPT